MIFYTQNPRISRGRFITFQLDEEGSGSRTSRQARGQSSSKTRENKMNLLLFIIIQTYNLV